MGIDNFGAQIWALLSVLVFSLPHILIYLVGIILSFTSKKRLGSAAMMAAGGFFLLLLGGLTDVSSQALFYLYFSPKGDFRSYQTVSFISNALSSVASLIGIALILIALLVRRPGEART